MAEIPCSGISERREDFPVETFHYLEGRLRTIRNEVMKLACMRADERQKGEEVYRVEREDIDAALVQIAVTETSRAAH